MTCTESNFSQILMSTIPSSKTVPKYLHGQLHSVIQHCLELITTSSIHQASASLV